MSLAAFSASTSSFIWSAKGGKPLHETDDMVLDQMLEMKPARYSACFTQSCRKCAQRSGHIIAIGSKAAVEPAPMVAALACERRKRNVCCLKERWQSIPHG
jgi:hypothetical protein